MEFETAQKTAERLGVTVRAVQKWAKENKIPYAHKVGGVWMIPCDADPLAEGHKNKLQANIPFAVLISPNEMGLLSAIEEIAEEDDRAIAMSGYYYTTGQLKEASICAEPYLDSKNIVLRAAAAVFCIFSNICRQHMHKAHFASEILKETLEEVFSKETSIETRAVVVFAATIVKMQLHLPLDNLPHIEDYIKYLPEGVKMMAIYCIAYRAYFEKDYSKAVGIIETARFFCKNRYPIAEIYIHIIAAVSRINLMQVSEAQNCLERAWALAEAEGLYMPFVEHYSLLQGMIEKHFKRSHPEAFKRIVDGVKEYNTGWYQVYNENNENIIAENLTHTEFTIGMLYSRNWRAKEIAAHMELSERTVVHYISIIYDKLQINSKKELSKYMLK